MHGKISTPSDLGHAVQKIRTIHNLSQIELAEMIGVSQRYLSELERGRPKIFDERYLKVLSKLGIQLGFEAPDE